jgi:hypothetical protein
MPHPLGEQLLERLEQRRRTIRMLTPDLQCQAVEEQVEVERLHRMGAVIGEVIGGFRRAGKPRCGVLYDGVLLLSFALSLSVMFVSVVRDWFSFARHRASPR